MYLVTFRIVLKILVLLQPVFVALFFPGPQAFCKKAVERVRSEKNILNSSVEWSGWSGFFRKKHMYVHHQIRLSELINMMYFIFNFNAYFSRNWRKTEI